MLFIFLSRYTEVTRLKQTKTKRKRTNIMKKVNKITVILTVVLVIAIIATVAEIICSIKEARTIDWLPIIAIFTSLTVAFSSQTKKKDEEK